MGVYIGTSELKNAYIGEVWTPGSNTLAYFPFTNNSLDELGNYTLTNSGTKQTIGYLFNTSTYINIGSGTYSEQKFASYWIKFYDNGVLAVMISVGGMRTNNRVVGKSYAEFVCKNSSGTFINMGNNGMNNDIWYHIAYGWSGNSYKTYINGELKNSGNVTPFQYSECCLGSGFTISDLIIEDTLRTQAEIQDYYNKTKSNYGL